MAELRILIVDDTILYRTILRAAVSTMAGCSVAGTAANGKIALEMMAETPVDLVLLDIEMPVLDGLKTLECIRRDFPGVSVIMVSGITENAAAITIQALQRGALEFIRKPDGVDREQSRKMLQEELSLAIHAFQLTRQGSRGRPAPVTPRPVSRPSTLGGPRVAAWGAAKRVEAIAIGVSTGGPNALDQVVPKLPANLGVPVFLVQHMPAVFTASLAKSLAKKSKLDVREAANGDPVVANRVYVAPGGRHMLVLGGGQARMAGPSFITLSDDPPEQNCRPSVNVTFRAVASRFGGNVLGIIMTGMGADGCDGMRAIKERGGYSLTQDAASCVVYGMPRAVVDAGLSDESVGLDALADRIASIVKRPIVQGV